MSIVAAFGATFFRLPMAGLFVTLAAYEAALFLGRRIGSPVWANPVLPAVALVVAVLELTATSYEVYFETAKLVHLLLGPAVVALAVPLLYQSAHHTAVGVRDRVWRCNGRDLSRSECRLHRMGERCIETRNPFNRA